MLLDSNIFIYATLPEHSFLRQWFTIHDVCASNITRLEVLGYHHLSKADKFDLNRLFECVTIYPVSSPSLMQPFICGNSARCRLEMP